MSELKQYDYDEILNEGIPNDFGIIISADSLKSLWKDKKSADIFFHKIDQHFLDTRTKYGLDETIFMQSYLSIVIQSIDGKKVIKLSEESIIDCLFIFFDLDYRAKNYLNLSYQEKSDDLNQLIDFLRKCIRLKIKELEKVTDIDELIDISYQLYLSYAQALMETPSQKNDPTWNFYFREELNKDIAKFKKFNLWLKEFIKDTCKPIDKTLFNNIDLDKFRLFLGKQYLEFIKNNLYDNILVLDFLKRIIDELADKDVVIENQYFLTKVEYHENDTNLSIEKYTNKMLNDEFLSLLQEHPNLREQLDILSKFSKNDFLHLNQQEVKEYVSLILEDVKDNWKNIDKAVIEKELDELMNLSKNNDKNKINLLIHKIKFLLEHKPIRIIQGESTFKGYYGFIYPNGKIILESLYEDSNKKKISYGNAIYQMDLKTFKEKGNLSKTELFSQDKEIRIRHDEGWENKLEAILKIESVDDTILEIENIDLDSIINLEDLDAIIQKLEELEHENSTQEIKKKKRKINKRRKKIIVNKIETDLTENPWEDYTLFSDREQFIEAVNEIGNFISKSNFIEFFDEYYKLFSSKANFKKVKRNPAIAAYTKVRANNTCDCCGDRYDSIRMFDSHHLIPLSKGGVDNIYNTVCLCPRCHRIAHAEGFTNNQLYILIEKIKQYLIEENLDEYFEKFNELFLPFQEIIAQEKFFMEWNGYHKLR